MHELHRRFDVILTPTVATPPLKGDALEPCAFEKPCMRFLIATGPGRHAVNDRSLEMVIEKSLCQTPFTPIANMTGQPAMSVPLHWDDSGLPHGAHFMAGMGEDGALFMLGHQLEMEYPWVGRIPDEIR